MEESTKLYATFTLENLLFGIEVERVQEVLQPQEMTKVPVAPDMVHGLINLRGQIVTALDIRKRLGVKAVEPGRSLMNLIIRDVDGLLSLLVDDIGDVIEVHSASYRIPPASLSAVYRSMITGVYELPENLLLVLDTERVSNCEG